MLFVPVPELVTLVVAVALAFGIYAAMRFTDLGRALRALAEDPADRDSVRGEQACARAGARRRVHRACRRRGVCLALSFTLTPAQIYAWVGVVFAAVMLGGLGSALGPLAAGIVIGVSEALTMAVASPSWAPIVSFSLLIALLIVRPGKA